MKDSARSVKVYLIEILRLIKSSTRYLVVPLVLTFIFKTLSDLKLDVSLKISRFKISFIYLYDSLFSSESLYNPKTKSRPSSLPKINLRPLSLLISISTS